MERIDNTLADQHFVDLFPKRDWETGATVFLGIQLAAVGCLIPSLQGWRSSLFDIGPILVGKNAGLESKDGFHNNDFPLVTR